jgi:hypothetical protein
MAVEDDQESEEEEEEEEERRRITIRRRRRRRRGRRKEEGGRSEQTRQLAVPGNEWAMHGAALYTPPKPTGYMHSRTLSTGRSPFSLGKQKRRFCWLSLSALLGSVACGKQVSKQAMVMRAQVGVMDGMIVGSPLVCGRCLLFFLGGLSTWPHAIYNG